MIPSSKNVLDITVNNALDHLSGVLVTLAGDVQLALSSSLAVPIAPCPGCQHVCCKRACGAFCVHPAWIWLSVLGADEHFSSLWKFSDMTSWNIFSPLLTLVLRVPCQA